MTETSVSNPHITGEVYSPLETLIGQALRRYGDFSSGQDGEVNLMMLELANQTIEDVRSHPYWDTDVELSYYTDLQQSRPVPDEIIRAGLMYYYSIQQASSKINLTNPIFYRRMSQILWNRRWGTQAIYMQVMDGGSEPNDFKRQEADEGLLAAGE